MAPATRLRTKLQMLLQIESSGFALGLAILFVLVSLALPFWSISRTSGAVQDIQSFSWVSLTTEQYTRGAWSVTTIVPYSFPSFPYPDTAGVAGNVYVLTIVLLVGVVLGVGGAVLPYLKSLRSMVPTATTMRPST